jgi:predicted enzyme related to lactoylglutathione lyase
MQISSPVKVRGIDVTAYLVKDVPRAIAFYRDTMGLEITMGYGDNGAEFTFPDGTTFGLWKMQDGSWTAGNGVMFAVDDVPTALEYYKSRGVKFEDYTHDGESCMMAFGEDSEGNTFILHQRKGGRD